MRTSAAQSRPSRRSWKLVHGVCGVLLALAPAGCAVGSSGGATSSSAAAGEGAASTGVVQAAFFGMVVKNPVHQPTIVAGARRLCDPSVTWAAVEPAEGSFAWTGLDAELAAAEASGAEITLTLGMTPTWASSAPSAPSNWGAGATVMPASMDAWDAYVTAVATHYKGRIAHYEVWNDTSDPANWSGDSTTLGSDMALLSAHTRADVAVADPAASVVAPAMATDALGEFLAQGGAGSVSAIAVALPVGGSKPEALVDELASVRATLAADPEAELLPLWNDQPVWSLTTELSDADQAAYAARALVLNASFGIRRMEWYAWDETESGVLRLSEADGQATLAASAYATVESWLTGATVNGCASTPAGLWSCQLVRGGAPAWILWSTNGTVEASSLGMSISTGLDGFVQGVSGTKLLVDGSPVLLQ